jgi:hypothetical protein
VPAKVVPTGVTFHFGLFSRLLSPLSQLLKPKKSTLKMTLEAKDAIVLFVTVIPNMNQAPPFLFNLFCGHKDGNI